MTTFQHTYESGIAKRIQEMKNVDLSEFKNVLNILSEIFTEKYRVEPGRKSQRRAEEMLS